MMNPVFMQEMERTDRFDVLVCGSGPAGLAAALQAARCGLRVGLIEREGCFGGNMTAGLVCHLLGGRRWNKDLHRMEREVGGLFDEITDELIAEGNAVDPDTIDAEHDNPYGWYPRMAAGIPCDVEALKRKLDRKILEAGVRPFLLTTVIGAEVKDRRIQRIFASDQSGLRAFAADTVIDATGDAQVAWLAGCACRKGREEDGLMTPATLMAHVDRVDLRKYVDYQNAHRSPKLIEIIRDLQAKGVWRFPFEIFIAVKLNGDDVCMLNTVRQVGVDGTSADSLTRAMIEGREVTEELLEIMHRYFPGFENARIRTVANRIGIRESRRIDGRSYVTLEDANLGKTYPDQVIRTTYNFDLPDPKRPSFDPMLGSVENPNAERKHVGIQIPYGCLLPRELENLVVCGRCISVSREVLGPSRVTGPAMMGGQAAGFAAVIARETGGPADAVDGRQIRKRMMDAGCKI